MSQKLFWPPFLNRFFWFSYFGNVNLFKFPYFEPNFIESGFSNFGHVAVFAKWKLVYWPPFRNCIFCLFIYWFRCRYGASSVPKFLWESSFRGGSSWTNESQKYLMHLCNGHLELALLKLRQRFDAILTSNLEVYKFRNLVNLNLFYFWTWWIFT